jgi:leader peptidase (prepilin peptidase)/N-methyltransferase
MFMGIKAIFTPAYWAVVPFHFWSVVFFTFGSLVGSFLNVCIHRLPLGQSVVTPPSHCPHCKYSIPWYLNVPLLTWVWLRGKCANCGAPISVRYFLVELLTGVTFLACWLVFGHQSAGLALAYCLLLAGLIAASFIDLEHFIIPDEITIGGVFAGLICSFLLPMLHDGGTHLSSLGQGVLGALAGGGLIYSVVRLGKLIFGRQKFKLGSPCKVIFNDTSMVLPGLEIEYVEMFYRKSDTIKLKASVLELCDRCYKDVWVRLSPSELWIDDEVLKPDDVPFMEATTELVVVPREAMGLGDVKFMAAIGAFLGWQAVIFSLAVSSMIGSVVGLTLIAVKRLGKGRPMQFGPYIALAAVIWVFIGHAWWKHFWIW